MLLPTSGQIRRHFYQFWYLISHISFPAYINICRIKKRFLWIEEAQFNSSSRTLCTLKEEQGCRFETNLNGIWDSMNNCLAQTYKSELEEVFFAVFSQLIIFSINISISSYLWQQRCYWTESAPACHGPHTPLFCFCLRLRLSVPPSVRASRLSNRWKMLRRVFSAALMSPGDETRRIGFGWTQIQISPPVPSQNLPEPPADAGRRRTRLSKWRRIEMTYSDISYWQSEW